MTWESFATGILAILIWLLIFVVAGILLGLLLGSAGALVMRLRNKSMGDVRRKQDPKSEVQRKLQKDAPQPTSDQQRLYEIEESISWATGAIQANPMSPGATSLSEEIQHLEQEKKDLRKKIADNMDQITVQKVWNTFLPEQQEKFQDRIYQYEQDVNRGSTEPEIAAANRGLRIVNGSPVPEEVANRLKTIQQMCMKDEQIQKEPASREQIKAEYQAFLEGEGKFPRGFSNPYIEKYGNYVCHGTPFRKYLDTTQSWVDSLRDESGFSDWLYFDGSLDIPDAVEKLIRWRNLHREMASRLRAQYHAGGFTIGFPVKPYGDGTIMVVTADISPFRNLDAETKQACREANISFCTILSEDSLYDLLEQKEKKIQYTTYPNYHDETCASWWLE